MLKAIVTLVVLTTLSGCGTEADKLADVTGQVLLDGKPLTTGTVITTPDRGRGAQGRIDGEGRFRLTSGDLGPGAIVGVHRVAVVATEESDSRSPEAPIKLLVPQRYTNPATSHLVIDVQPGKVNEVVLELSSKQD